jgi:SPP1 family predicted phage head-tail adaptor
MPYKIYRIGDFRHRITVERRATTRDKYGQSTDSWLTLFICWSTMTMIEGYEKDVDNKKAGFGKFEFVIRSPSLSPTIGDRISYDGVNYDINAIDTTNEGAKAFVRLICYAA